MGWEETCAVSECTKFVLQVLSCPHAWQASS